MFQFVALPLRTIIGLWRIRAVRSLLSFCLGGSLLQRRIGFLACFDVVNCPGFIAVRTAALWVWHDKPSLLHTNSTGEATSGLPSSGSGRTIDGPNDGGRQPCRLRSSSNCQASPRR